MSTAELLPLASYDLSALQARLAELGQPPSRARPILKAFYRGAGSFDPRTLPISHRLMDCLEAGPLLQATILRQVESQDGTLKLLVGVGGDAVECVLMPADDEKTAAVCLSSQVGCAVRCDFCASARPGLVRNLSAAEIVEQFVLLKAEATRRGRRLRTLVLMGMGEPLHNVDNVLAAIHRLADWQHGELGWARITVSTAGVIPGIERLMQEQRPPVMLALSLHAPDDETRSRLVPLNKRYDVASCVSALRRYAEVTGTIPSVEYCLLEGINDSEAQATRLAELLSDFWVHVNLIPYNPTGSSLSGASYRPSPRDRRQRFWSILRERGLYAHFRGPRGDDVAAACGQLAATSAR